MGESCRGMNVGTGPGRVLGSRGDGLSLDTLEVALPI